MPSNALHRQIADAIRADILSGALRPGTPAPSENELAAQFSTTRNTVRKGLALLKAEGLLVSEQGKRTSVRPRPKVRLLSTGANHRSHRARGLPAFNGEVLAQGRRPDQRLLEVLHVPAPQEIAERLEVDEGTTVLVRRRLFMVDDEPMQLCDGYYPLDLVAGTAIEEKRKIRGGAHLVIEDPDGPIRRRIVRFVEDLELRMPTPAEINDLRVPPGVPVARTLRTAYDSSGAAVEVLDSVLPGDRHAFRYVIDVP
ncbi:GntR family transcriptional regulator [Streptosporangium saharense]|uniref:GntR family transcriptional regulator n=1 Tax=Streptosporangium saharense TaxID=1706840 RepID=UPI00367B2BCC